MAQVRWCKRSLKYHARRLSPGPKERKTRFFESRVGAWAWLLSLPDGPCPEAVPEDVRDEACKTSSDRRSGSVLAALLSKAFKTGSDWRSGSVLATLLSEACKTSSDRRSGSVLAALLSEACKTSSDRRSGIVQRERQRQRVGNRKEGRVCSQPTRPASGQPANQTDRPSSCSSFCPSQPASQAFPGGFCSQPGLSMILYTAEMGYQPIPTPFTDNVRCIAIHM